MVSLISVLLRARQRLTFAMVVNCDGNPKFIPTMAGGDGFDTQYCKLLQLDLVYMSLIVIAT